MQESSILREASYDETVVIDGQIIPKDKTVYVLLPRYKHVKGATARELIYLSMVDIWGEHEADFLCSQLFPEGSLKRSKRKLRSIGLLKRIEKHSAEELKALNIRLSHKGRTCEWCGRESYLLHAHHYPIPKHEGGTETVKICPNCHCTYHSLYKKQY